MNRTDPNTTDVDDCDKVKKSSKKSSSKNHRKSSKNPAKNNFSTSTDSSYNNAAEHDHDPQGSSTSLIDDESKSCANQKNATTTGDVGLRPTDSSNSSAIADASVSVDITLVNGRNGSGANHRIDAMMRSSSSKNSSPFITPAAVLPESKEAEKDASDELVVGSDNSYESTDIHTNANNNNISQQKTLSLKPSSSSIATKTLADHLSQDSVAHPEDYPSKALSQNIYERTSSSSRLLAQSSNCESSSSSSQATANLHHHGNLSSNNILSALLPTTIHGSGNNGNNSDENQNSSTSASSSTLPQLLTSHATKNNQPCCSREINIDSALDAAIEAMKKLELETGVRIVGYSNESQLGAIMQLITADLSEPYSIYTYRYFIHNWPHLCFLAQSTKNDDEGEYVGVIVCKLSLSRQNSRRGYIAMLAVDQNYRRKKIASRLVEKSINAMKQEVCDEVVLETEVTNQASLNLYEKLGFIRDKRLFRYYLNGVDAFRLKLWLAPPMLTYSYPFH